MVPASINDQFRDGQTARFRNVTARYLVLSNGIRKVEICGLVNAKNGFGAYTGWQTFFIGGPPTRLSGFSIDSAAYEMNCEGPGTVIAGDYQRFFGTQSSTAEPPADGNTASRRRIRS